MDMPTDYRKHDPFENQRQSLLEGAWADWAMASKEL